MLLTPIPLPESNNGAWNFNFGPSLPIHLSVSFHLPPQRPSFVLAHAPLLSLVLFLSASFFCFSSSLFSPFHRFVSLLCFFLPQLPRSSSHREISRSRNLIIRSKAKLAESWPTTVRLAASVASGVNLQARSFQLIFNLLSDQSPIRRANEPRKNEKEDTPWSKFESSSSVARKSSMVLNRKKQGLLRQAAGQINAS